MGMAMAEPPALLKALANRAVAADVDALKVGAQVAPTAWSCGFDKGRKPGER
jgi:hypothetical protein